MTIKDIVLHLESIAHPSLQEGYDNAGLLTGAYSAACTGVLVCLDCTEAVVEEAVSTGCNLVVAHHPILFTGLKKLNGNNYVERTIISAIKHNIGIYAIHTNLDNVLQGVNGSIADRLGLVNRAVLLPKKAVLKKLHTFVPLQYAEGVRNALFETGAGSIGKYKDCSFNVEGEGSFRGGEDTNPFVGAKGERHLEKEVRVEVIFPAHLQEAVVKALLTAHPYEEVAYDIVPIDNTHQGIGSGLAGELPVEMNERSFLTFLKSCFELEVIRHTRLTGHPVRKVAVCGGAGSFLIQKAIAVKADFFISSDIKYHEFFDANDQLVVADIGHYESEQYTTALLLEILQQKFPTFALLKSKVITNPVHYFMS